MTTLSPVMEISQRMVRVSLGKRFNWGCRNSECDTNLEHTSVRWARTMRCEAENNRHPLCESPVVTGQVLLKSVFTTLGPCLHPVFVHNTEDDVCIDGNLNKNLKKRKKIEVLSPRSCHPYRGRGKQILCKFSPLRWGLSS